MNAHAPTSWGTHAPMGLIVAASLASTIGGLPFNVLPVMLGSMADAFKIGADVVGNIGSICFAGYLLGTLGAPFWMNRLNWRVLTLVSAAGTSGAFVLSAQVSSLPVLYAVWALIGFFASTMTCLGMRILSDLSNKERAFGLRQGVELAVTAGVLFVLPPLVIASWNYPGAALALAAVVAALSVSAFWLPTRPLGPCAAGASAPSDAGVQGIPGAAWVSLACFFLFLMGNIALWAFLERIGKALTVAPAEMGVVFSVLKLLGAVAAFCVAALGERGGARLPHVLVWLGVLGGLGLLASAAGFGAYAAGAWLWEFSFTCGCVYQAAVIARRDASGRAVVLIPAAFALAAMVGPGLAGQLVSGGGFQWVLLLAGLCSALPVGLYGRAGR